MSSQLAWQVRPFYHDDAEAVAALFAENNEPGFTAARILQRYHGSVWSQAHCLCDDAGQLVGFFGLLRSPFSGSDGQAHTALLFCDMVVARARRRQGVASAAIAWLKSQGLPQLNVGMNAGMYASLRANGYPALHQLHLAYRYRLPKALRARPLAVQPVEVCNLEAVSTIPYHMGCQAGYLRFRYADVPQVQAFQGDWGTAVVQVLPTQLLLLDLFGPEKGQYVRTCLRLADALLAQFPNAQRVTWLANRRFLLLWRWLAAGALIRPNPVWFTALHAPTQLLSGPLSLGLPDFVSPYPPTIR